VRSLFATLLLASALSAAGQEPPRGSPAVDAIVPVPPHEHQRLHYFGRRHHHLVPGTVTIDHDAYVCDLDGRHFGERDEFIAHLRTVHRTPAARIPDQLLVRDGRVHFVGQ